VTLAGTAVFLEQAGVSFVMEVDHAPNVTTLSADLSFLVGSPGVVSQLSSGVALVIGAEIVFPCQGSWQFYGTVYVYFPSYNFAPAPFSVDVTYFCAALAFEGSFVDFVANATLPRLAFNGFSMASLSVTLIAGRNIVSGITTPFHNTTISGSAGYDNVGLQLFVNMSETRSSPAIFIASALLSYFDQYSTNGTIAASGVLAYTRLSNGTSLYSGNGQVSLRGLPYSLPSITAGCFITASTNFASWSLGVVSMGPIYFPLGDDTFMLGAPLLRISYNRSVVQRLNISMEDALGSGTLYVRLGIPFTGIKVGGHFDYVTLSNVSSLISGRTSSKTISPNNAVQTTMDSNFDEIRNAILSTSFTDLDIAFWISSTPAIAISGKVSVLGVSATGAFVFFRAKSMWSIIAYVSIDISVLMSITVPKSETATKVVRDVVGTLSDSLANFVFVYGSTQLTNPAILGLLDRPFSIINPGLALAFFPVKPTIIETSLQTLTAPGKPLNCLAPLFSQQTPLIGSFTQGKVRLSMAFGNGKVAIPLGSVFLTGVSLLCVGR
jgi:hypothetical protein